MNTFSAKNRKNFRYDALVKSLIYTPYLNQQSGNEKKNNIKAV